MQLLSSARVSCLALNRNNTHHFFFPRARLTSPYSAAADMLYPCSADARAVLAAYTRSVPSPPGDPAYDVELPSAPSPPPSPLPTKRTAPSHVYVIDMDETLIVFNHLLTGKYAAATKKVCVGPGCLGNGWRASPLTVASTDGRSAASPFTNCQ